MNNATNSVVENRMEPVGKSDKSQQVVLTGQYLYDTFMKATDGEATKMAIIRKWVEDGYDAMQVGGACDTMVKLGFQKDSEAWQGPRNDKDVPIGPDGKKVRGAKEQSAMNVRGVIQNAYGALKFARTELDAEGYDETTGYLVMQRIAKRALDAKRITWKGEAQKTDADRATARLRKEQKGEVDALQQVQKDNPREHGESLSDWSVRTMALAEKAMSDAWVVAEIGILTKLYASLLEKHGLDRVIALGQMIAHKNGLILGREDEEGEQGDSDEAELTDEQVAERMVAVPEEQAAH